MISWSGQGSFHEFGTILQYARSIGINTSWNQPVISEGNVVVLGLLDVQSINGLISDWSSTSQAATRSNVYSRITISMTHIEKLDAYLAIQHSSFIMLESKVLFHRFIFIVETPIIINRHGVTGFTTSMGALTLRLRDRHHWIDLGQRGCTRMQHSLASR